MTNIDWKPDREKLRQFGWFGLAGFTLISLVLGWRLGWFSEGYWLAPGILWGLAVFSALGAVTNPILLKPLYYVMTAISAVVGPIISTIIMGLIFFLAFLPLGLIFRLSGRDELRLRLDQRVASYWSDKPVQHPPTRYFRQY